jgi:hypothetical protein
MAGINSNPYIIGLMMLLLNLGGRFLALEVSKEQEKVLSQPIVRRFLLFVVLFVGTRNILIAAGLTIIVILFVGYLFNENSDLCVWRSCAVASPTTAKTESFTGLTSEEAMIFKRLEDKKRAAATPDDSNQANPPLDQSPPIASLLYRSALSKLR